MSTTFALFGGIYSNHLALQAVLDDVKREGSDHTWCLGDLGGFGPQPNRAAELIRSSGLPMLRGNYDLSIGDGLADCGCGYTDPSDNHFAQLSYDYTLANTAAEHRAWMQALPEHHRFEHEGRRVLLCHGSPRQVNEFLWDSACSDAFLEWLCDEHRADLIVCAHTGLHWHRALPSGRHVVNAGAIGRAANDGHTHVWYARIELNGGVEVAFRRVAYDHEALAAEMVSEKLPREFIETIRSGWWTTCLENMPARERARGKY